jgi:hypothetical protein|tara:strand:- start:51 stop:548 length:498 start_codon:yes stop_codon:yes gene_type:complete
MATARPEDIDVSQLGSMFGVRTSAEPDYLEYDIRGRGYLERCFFNCGISYLGGMIGGGLYGTVQGFSAAPRGANLRVRSNALMNGFGKHGSNLGNSAGVVALMFTSFESACETVELDKLCGDNDFVARPRPANVSPERGGLRLMRKSANPTRSFGSDERTPNRAF